MSEISTNSSKSVMINHLKLTGGIKESPELPRCQHWEEFTATPRKAANPPGFSWLISYKCIFSLAMNNIIEQKQYTNIICYVEFFSELCFFFFFCLLFASNQSADSEKSLESFQLKPKHCSLSLHADCVIAAINNSCHLPRNIHWQAIAVVCRSGWFRFNHVRIFCTFPLPCTILGVHALQVSGLPTQHFSLNGFRHNTELYSLLRILLSSTLNSK